jgi:hypothetical protein
MLAALETSMTTFVAAWVLKKLKENAHLVGARGLQG